MLLEANEMETFQQEIPKVDLQTQLIAFGYTRLAQKLLSTTSIFYNIPDSISYIVAAYLRDLDKFGASFNGFKISDDGYSAVLREKDPSITWSCAYGSNASNSTSDVVCEWKIKINEMKPACFVGIASNCCLDDQWQYQEQDAYYCLYCTRSQTEMRTMIEDYDPMAMGVNTNDIITLELNLKQREIKWMINDQERGILSDVEIGKNIKYYLAVSAFGVDYKVSILDFFYLSK